MPGSVGALIGALGGRPVEHKPSRSIFGDFQCQVILTNPTANVSPHQLIEGKIQIRTDQEIHHYGIRVQLEAFMDVKYETKVDNRVQGRHRKIGNLIAGASEPKEGYYIYSPINHQIFGSAEENDDESCIDTLFTIPRGCHSYPFQIQYTGENLPAPFRNLYGTLLYKISSYIRAEWCYVSLAEKPVKFRGFSNLAGREESVEFIRNECWLYKSIFSSKKAVILIFEVTNSQGGFLPGEEIHFFAKITNPKSYMVKHFSVALNRRTMYHIEGAISSKSTLASVGNFETLEVSNAKEIIWNGKILIPRNSPTSYCSKKIYQVLYHLEYHVKVQEYSRDLKGQLKVWIGTTRDTSREITRRMSNININEISEGGMHRTLSTMSSLSDSSVRTGPPDYSQLSSRCSSMMSIATCIRVQFEASIDVKYETKVDKGTVTKHRRIDNLVAGASELKAGNYIHSPIQRQIIGVPDENYEVSFTSAKFTITPGSYIYPFKIQYTGENLPSPFRNQYGTLHYKIAAYIRGEECYVSFAEKPLKFRGFSNLAEREGTTEFIRNECWVYKSIFSFKKSVAAVLEVTNSQRGFLPGEEIDFVLKITNPKSYEVKHFSVLLIRRTICHIQGATNSKSMLATANSFEAYDGSNSEEIVRNGKLGIPKNSPTIYCSKNIYHVFYYLEYQAKVQGYSRQLKGHFKVWIGTTRDATSEITGRMSNVNVHEISEGELHRMLSKMSNFSDSSVTTRPPKYSRLSSRFSSITPIVTLPPHYNDLM